MTTSLHDRVVDKYVGSTGLDRDRVLDEYGDRIQHEVGMRERVRAKYAATVGCPTVAANLELATYNWLLRSCGRDGIPLYWQDNKLRFRYTTRVMQLISNLKRDDSALLARLLDPDDAGVTAKKLVDMTPQEMRPKFWEEQYERTLKHQLRRESPLNLEDVPDGVFMCGKCRDKKTVYRCVQIRSADEPMTVFVSCLKCGENWKLNE
jgi:DNA-directed RNA polymerase subunit M/transcription elongation factor TFIIS